MSRVLGGTDQMVWQELGRLARETPGTYQFSTQAGCGFVRVRRKYDLGEAPHGDYSTRTLGSCGSCECCGTRCTCPTDILGAICHICREFTQWARETRSKLAAFRSAVGDLDTVVTTGRHVHRPECPQMLDQVMTLHQYLDEGGCRHDDQPQLEWPVNWQLVSPKHTAGRKPCRSCRPQVAGPPPASAHA